MKKIITHPVAAIYLGLNALIMLASSFFFVTYVPFLAEKGMNLIQINVINSFYMVVVILAEMPTGSFADNFGRHRSLSLSFFLLSLSTFVYFISGSFFLFVLAEIIAALGHTFASGAAEAWLVDSLKAREEKHLQAKIFRYEALFKALGTIAGVLLGSYLGKFDLAWPWLVSSVLMLIIAGLSLFIKENYQLDRVSLRKKALTRQLSTAWQTGIKSKSLLFIMLFGACLAFAIQALNMQWTLLFKDEYQFSSPRLGFLYVAITLSLALGAYFSKKAHNFLGEKTAIILPQIGTAIAIIIASQASITILVIGAFLLHEFGRGIIKPLQQSYLNSRLDSENRATLLSLDSMFNKLGAFFGLLVSGFLAELTSIRTAWLYSGIFLFFGVLIFVFINGKKIVEIKKRKISFYLEKELSP